MTNRQMNICSGIAANRALKIEFIVDVTFPQGRLSLRTTIIQKSESNNPGIDERKRQPNKLLVEILSSLPITKDIITQTSENRFIICSSNPTYGNLQQNGINIVVSVPP